MTTHLDIEKERRNFEVWVASSATGFKVRASSFAKNSDGNYQVAEMRHDFTVWLAARRASLPPFAAPAGQREASTSVLTDERIDLVIEALKPEDNYPALRRFARAIEAEVASRCRAQGGNTQPNGDARASLQASVPAQTGTPRFKDHNIRQLVNDLRDIALTFHATQQLRSRIQYAVHQFLATPAETVASLQADEGKEAGDGAMLAELYRLRDWFESQRKAISKGCGSTWDMVQCSEQIELISAAITAKEGK
jgi:uncharacterized protein (DUF885 family)